MAGIRAAVTDWVRHDGVGALPLERQKALGLALFSGAACEDKLAGTLLFAEHLLGELERADLDALGRLFDDGLIADWNTCDWFCVKVLGKLVARDLPARPLADAIARWRAAQVLWKRRAANVAFVNLARRGDANFPGFTALMLETCAVTVRSSERFAQTGVGWLLRELSLAERQHVIEFARTHVSRLSREAMRYIVEKLPDDQASELLQLQRPQS